MHRFFHRSAQPASTTPSQGATASVPQPPPTATPQSTNTQLCTICTNFNITTLYESISKQVTSTKPKQSSEGGFATYPGNPTFYQHHPSLPALHASANSGCYLCSAIWHESCKVLPRDVTTGRPVIPAGEYVEQMFLGLTSWIPEAQGAPYLCAVQTLARGAVRTLATFDAFVDGNEGLERGLGSLFSRPVGSDPAGREGLELVKEWHQDCLANHSQCAALFSKQKPLPTRAIDVGDANHNPRLIMTNGAMGSWAALSYCWGGNSPFVLNSQTAHGFFNAQTPLTGWPATLRDAITVTRALDLQYIWIDAICILQDSAADWAAEAARMKDVYGGALITICATASPSTNAGIFKPRTLPLTLCSLPLHIPQTNTAVEVALRSSSTFSDTTQKNEPLNSRGWTLQESLLSPRTLSYGTQQLIWECPSLKIAENGRPVLAGETHRDKAFVQEIMADHFSSLSKTALKFTKISVKIMPADKTLVPSSWEGRHDRGYCRWFAIVKDFSARNLTVQTDILPALAGVAKAFEHLLRDQYMAGLWKGDIVRGMCWSRGNLPKRDWRALKTGQSQSGRSDGVVPSWSWASVIGGRVGNTLEEEQTWPFIAVHEAAKVVAAGSTPLSTRGDPFGKVSDAFVVIKGPVRDVPVFRLPAGSVGGGGRDSLVLQERVRIEMGIQSSIDEYDQQHQFHHGQRYSVMRLLMTERVFENQFNGKKTKLPGASLLLLESTGNGDDYRRVGFVTVSVPADPDRNDINVRLLKEMKASKWETREVRIV